MQLNQLRYVMEVYKCGSISGAARKLFITQPSLSQQIILLEKELRVKLFVRNKRGVTLTDAGEEFIARAHRIIPEIDNLLGSMKSCAAQAKGKINTGVLWIFADLGLAEILSNFCTKYPHIKTTMTVNGSVKLLGMLRERRLDSIFFINAGDLRLNDLLTIKLFDSDMVLVLPANHRLVQKDVLHIRDLTDENIILPDKDSTIYAPITGCLRTFGVKPKIIAQSSQTDIALACAANGMAISFASDVIARRYKSERTVIRPLRPLIKREVYYAVLKEALAIPAIRLMTDYIGSLSGFNGL